MRISHRHRLIFFSFPKTASSTVRHVLDPYSDVRPVPRLVDVHDDNPFHPHMRPERVRECFDRLGWDFGGYTRFACVRNPWARLVSLYRHLGREESRPPFREWLLGLTADDPQEKRLWLRYGSWPLERFLKDRDGNVLVDKVLRTEDLDSRLIPFLRSLGVPIEEGREVPRRNRAGRVDDYRRFYDPSSRGLVRELYAPEIERFGYRFGEGA